MRTGNIRLVAGRLTWERHASGVEFLGTLDGRVVAVRSSGKEIWITDVVRTLQDRDGIMQGWEGMVLGMHDHVPRRHTDRARIEIIVLFRDGVKAAKFSLDELTS